MKTILILVALATSTLSQAADMPAIPAFIDEMVAKHQFKREELVRTFKRAERRQDVIDAISKPATMKPWAEYRATFVNQQRVDGGIKFWNKYEATLKRAEKQYGVPQEYIVAIIGVETLYGRNAGKFRTLDALTTLAFDYPKREEFFFAELEQSLL